MQHTTANGRGEKEPLHQETLRLIELDRAHTLLLHIEAILGWDQETYMPSRAIEERAAQLAMIEGIAHQKAIDPEIGELLTVLEGCHDLSDDEHAYVRVMRRDYDRETKLPEDFVVEYARAASLAQAAWAEARKRKRFAAFKPHLARMIDYNKQRAAFLNPTAKPYDVLLDLFEPGSTQASVTDVFIR